MYFLTDLVRINLLLSTLFLNARGIAARMGSPLEKYKFPIFNIVIEEEKNHAVQNQSVFLWIYTRNDHTEAAMLTKTNYSAFFFFSFSFFVVVVFVLEYVNENWGMVAHITVVSSQHNDLSTDPIIVWSDFFPFLNCFLTFQKCHETKTPTPCSLYVWLEHFYWEGA